MLKETLLPVSEATGKRFMGAQLFFFFALALSMGCKQTGAPVRELGGAAAATKFDRYTIKGIVRAVERKDREISVHHQSIKAFKDRQGELVGMASMTMPFAVESEIDLSRLVPGTKIRFTFETRWEEDNPGHVVAIETLPAAEEIDFSGD